MGSSFKKALKSISGYTKSDKKTVFQLLISVISLTMAVVVLVTMSFSWFSIKNSKLESGIFTLDCGKGLRVNDSGTTELSFSTTNKYLTPASSVDGRNIFFPTDGSDFSKNTESMTFRSSTVGDKNVNYIQIDFKLTAQQNHTALYINEEKTSIMVSNGSEWSIPQAAAIRAALWSSTAENGVPNTPIVFNPTSSTMRTAAVENVDRSTGAFISSGRQVAHAFSEYSFGGEPVATLSKGVETKFSYIIWLEGTDPKCTEKVLNKDIQINLAFTTSWDKTQPIRFEDGSPDSWVSQLLNRDTNPYTISLHYDEVDSNNRVTGNNLDFNMYKLNANDANNKIWTCNIPGDMRKQISFVLRSPVASEPIYKFTYDSKNPGHTSLDRGANRQYVANLSKSYSPYNSANDQCQGYWMAVGDSDGAGHDGGNFDGDDF